MTTMFSPTLGTLAGLATLLILFAGIIVLLCIRIKGVSDRNGVLGVFQLTEGEFPQGLYCYVCEREIKVGELYLFRISGTTEDDTRLGVLTCAGCDV